jgi:hypothetical protein
MKLIKEIYEYVWPKDDCKPISTARFATITKDVIGGFITVEYKCYNKIYNIDDWQFLHDLSKEVLAMYKNDVNTLTITNEDLKNCFDTTNNDYAKKKA